MSYYYDNLIGRNCYFYPIRSHSQIIFAACVWTEYSPKKIIYSKISLAKQSTELHYLIATLQYYNDDTTREQKL